MIWMRPTQLDQPVAVGPKSGPPGLPRDLQGRGHDNFHDDMNMTAMITWSMEFIATIIFFHLWSKAFYSHDPKYPLALALESSQSKRSAQESMMIIRNSALILCTNHFKIDWPPRGPARHVFGPISCNSRRYICISAIYMHSRIAATFWQICP